MAYELVDKVAVVAAAVVGLMLLFGARSALRWRLQRRSAVAPENHASGTDLVYPQEGLFSVLPFLAFNALIVFLSLYVPWPLWLRLIVALPFIFMGVVSSVLLYLMLSHRWRTRGKTKELKLKR